jgi:hypothetical protein
MEIKTSLILSTTRALFYGTIKCEPGDIDERWLKLTSSEQEQYIKIASEWLQALKTKSPKTFNYVENNYNEINFG